jgi:MFS family permease
MSTEQRDGIIDGIRLDVRRLHETWMELLFPRQRGAQHSVLGKWKPSTTGDTIKYRVWSAIGVPLVALLYPLMLFGVVVRFYSRRFDSLATRIGLGGTVLLMTVVWGALTAIVRFYGGFGQVGFVAVLVASVTAVVSSALAFVFWAKGGRATTVLLAYPFGVTAILLPPVVAAFYSDAVGAIVFSRSRQINIYLLNNLFEPLGLKQLLTDTFELQGLAFAAMWFAIAVPVGWLLGLLVTLANLTRPREDEDQQGDEGAEPSG